MANYIVNGNDLTSIADSIRSKSNISGELIWPVGFKNAVDNISVKDMCIKTAEFNDVVKIEDAAALDARNVVAKIEPVQDLHGYENPWPAGGGKNLFENAAESLTNNGVTFTVNSDGTITCSGTATGVAVLNMPDLHNISELSAPLILSGCPAGGDIENTFGLAATNDIGLKLYSDTGSGVTMKAYQTFAKIQIIIRSGTNANGLVFKPMIRLASNTDATYSTYSNICPIMGWDGVTVKDVGLNLAEFVQDKGIDMSGNVVNHNGRIATVTPIKIESGVAYKFIVFGNENTEGIIAVYNGTTLVRRTAYIQPNATLNTSGGDTFYFCCYDNTTIETAKAMIVRSTDAPVAYEPYKSRTASVDFPKTIYGGTVDLTTGECVVDRGYALLTGDASVNWINTFQSGVLFEIRSDTLSLPLENYSDLYITNSFSTNTARNNEESPIGSYVFSGTIRFKVPASIATTVDEFKAYLTTNPIQVVYALNATTEYNLTPQEIAMFKGTNVLSSTTGKTQLKYFTEAFEPLAEEIGFVNGGDY